MRCNSINSHGSCTLVTPHPVPRHDEKRRVIDEVVYVIETATRIGRRPLVQLCLHREYSGLRFTRDWPQIADIHQRPPRSVSLLRAHWTPSPCTRLSRCSDYYGSSAPLRQHRPATDLPRYARLAVAQAGTNGVVPTFTLEPFNGVGAQLCPCNLATATPQSFAVASRAGDISRPRSFPSGSSRRVRVATQPTSVRLELVVFS